MEQDLNNLLFQYAVAKGSIADPHDDDDFLVLGGGGWQRPSLMCIAANLETLILL